MAKRYRFRATKKHPVGRRWVKSNEDGSLVFADKPSLYESRKAFEIWQRVFAGRPDCEWVMEAVE